MSSPSTEYPESRPFKVFISLLDKWEIGGALTEAIVLDVFKALKALIEIDTASGEDVGSLCLRSRCPCHGNHAGRDDREYTIRSRGATNCVEAVVKCDIE
jgi:hypothetical protein